MILRQSRHWFVIVFFKLSLKQSLSDIETVHKNILQHLYHLFFRDFIIPHHMCQSRPIKVRKILKIFNRTFMIKPFYMRDSSDIIFANNFLDLFYVSIYKSLNQFFLSLLTFLLIFLSLFIITSILLDSIHQIIANFL